MSNYLATVERNRTWRLPCQWKLEGVPVNLTGYTLKCSIKTNSNTPYSLLDLTVGSGITITDIANGKFTLTLTMAQTNALPQVTMVFDVLAISPGGEGDTIFSGTMSLVDTVTSP